MRNTLANTKMKNKIILLTGIFILAIGLPSNAQTLHVGKGKTYQNPTQAAKVAQPGDTIRIHPGNYRGTFLISNLRGTAKSPIVIMGADKNQVLMDAGTEGFHFSDVAYLKIQDLTFSGQTANGMSIDDAGSFDTPSKHLIISNCDFKNMGAQGNNDFLKLSGVDSFEVSNCKFINGAAGGSGIDMVGCHYGVIKNCTLDSMGANSIQIKGGSQYIRVENNVFHNGGQRSLNLGGSTGRAFFRPQNATFEAADLQVYGNVFIKSQVPIAFVGSERVDVANNTIYLPEKWIIRILQETVDTSRFVPCRNNWFRNNIIYYSNVVNTPVNIGGNTLPATFLFGHNLWYNHSDPSNSSPKLPVTETDAINGQDPLFINAHQFSLQAKSPAIQSGTPIKGLSMDVKGNHFKSPPSMGAFEYVGKAQ